MADQADVMDVLQAISTAACFPCGTSQPSVTGRIVAIGQGWPIAADIDKAIASGQTLVSIYAVPGTTGTVVTPFDWNPGTVIAPIHGIAAVVSDTGFVLSGLPNPGEYASAIINGVVYSAVAELGDTAEVLAASLARDLAVVFPGTIWSSGPYGDAIVTVPGASSIVVRIGAPATMGQISHRQRQNFQITVWAPTPSDRTAVARAIDAAVKATLSIPLPDTSEAIVRAQGSNLDDKRQETSGYHRALIYNVEWDTLDEYPAWEITAPVTSIPQGGLTATATS